MGSVLKQKTPVARKRQKETKLEQDLMSPNNEAPTAVVASRGVRPTPSIFARGEVEISSGEEVLVRPNVGREVAARICSSTEQLKFTSVDSELSSFHEDRAV